MQDIGPETENPVVQSNWFESDGEDPNLSSTRARGRARRMAAPFHPLIVKQEPLDEAPQKTFPDPAPTSPPPLKVKLEVAEAPSRCCLILTFSPTCTPATPEDAAIIEPPMGPDCLEGGTEGELLEVWEKSEALFSKKASAAGTEVPAPDLEPQGGQMHIEPTPLGRADAVGGEATDSVSEPPAQDESVSAAQSAAEAEAERLRENLRMMSEMMARLQDKVLATCGQTTEEFAEVQRLLEKNESLLHQPLALEQGHGSRNAAGLVSEGALVEWQSGEIDREGVEGERGGDVGSCESEPDGATFEKGVPVEANAPEMFVNGVTGLQSTDSEVRGAVGRSNPLQAKAPVAATFADVQPAEGPSTLGKEGPIVTPQQELEGRVDEGGLVLPGLEEEPGVPSSKGSVSGDSLTAGGVTAGVSGSPSEATTAAEGLHSSPEFEDLPGVSFNPKTPAKTDLTAWGGAAESLDAPSREVSQSASEVLSTAGPNANTHSGVNGHLSENGHLSLSALPTLEPFDDDEGSGLEDNDDGFDSEPEEAPLAEEEQIAVVPMVVPLLFSESDEEEGGGSTKPDGVSLEGLSSREGSVREPEVVMERVKKTVKGPGKQRLAGGSKGKKGHSGRAEKGGRGGEIKSKGTRGEATPAEQRAWKTYDHVFKRSFMRVMLPSHVGGGYWLGVPIPTANRFMKRGQYLVTFESGGSKHSVVWLWRAPDRPPRNGEKSPKVKSDSRGFSGGWKGFARDHGLVTGDAVVFEKVCNRRFRLHLFRRSDYGGNVERAAKAANEKGERLDGEGGGEDSASTGGPKKRAIAGEETEVGVGRSVGKQSTPVDVSGGGATGTTDGTTGKGVPGIVTNKKGRSLEEGADEGSREKRRKVGVGEHEREGAKESGEALIAENTEDIGLRLGAERRLRGVETLVEMANKKKSSQFERIMSTKISLVIKELTNARNGPLAAEAGRPRLGERMETGVNAKKGRETFALGDPQVGKRHAKVTDCFPVVKKARVGVPNGSVKEEEGRCENGLKERSLPAGTAVVTAGTTAGREPERSGGGKRVKHTPKRGHSQVRGGSESKKRARIDGKEPPRKVQKGARVGVVPAERKSGTADEPEAEYEGGRLVHYVDGGHRYVEASAADKDAAKAAMEKCASAFPTFRVALSKSQTDKGFWLGGMTDFFRQTGLDPLRMTALADARGRVWHAKINSQAAALSGGWRGFALDHRLEVGDAIVLALVLPYVFAVRIFRASRGGKEDDCGGAGGASEGQPVRGEERNLSGEQKKRLANILGLSGGLPSRSRPPPHSVPALPTPRKGKASVTPKLAPKTPIAQVKVGPKAEGSALEKASGAKAKSETAPLSGGSNGAAVSATRVPPAVNRSWPVVPRSAAAIRKSLQVGGREHGPSPPVAAPEEPGERPGSGSSDHLGASGTSGPSGRADTAGRTGVSGSFGLSWAAKTSEHLGTSGTSGPSGRLKISGKKAGVSGRFGPSGRAEIGRFGPSKTAEVPWFAGALGEFGPSWSSKASGRAESSGNPRASGTGGASAKSGASGIGELGKAGTSESQGSPKTGASGKEASAKGETDSSARVTTMVQVKHSKVAVAFRVDRKKKGGVKSNAELMAERLNML